MRRRAVVALSVATLSIPCAASSVDAQLFTGTFTVPLESGGVLTLTLGEARAGALTGSMTGGGATYRVEGTVEGERAVGVMTGPDGILRFDAERWDDELWVTLYGTDADGQPDPQDRREIGFVWAGRSAAGGGPPRSGAGNPFAPGSVAGGGGNPLAGGGDPFDGTFTDGTVTLQLHGTGGQYRGQVAVGGQWYPVTASGTSTGLQGVVQAPDGSFAMTVRAVDGGLYLESGGRQYYLFAQGAGLGYAPGTGYDPTGAYGPNGLPIGPGSGRGWPGAGGVQPPGAGSPFSPGLPGGSLGYGGRLGPAFTEDDPRARQWVGLLQGNKLTRLTPPARPGGAAGARMDADLCGDRSFQTRDASPSRLRAGGIGGSGEGQGVWYVVSDGTVDVLTLDFRDGRYLEFALEYRNGETYANGGRVYLTRAELCR